MSIGPCDPFWIEDGVTRLYGAMHHAESPTATLGLLLVPPLLHEQPRSRRFIAEVASGLATLGWPSLRFDFAGTGDSEGAGDQLGFASIGRDLDAAATSLRAHSGTDHVAILAWRGAALPVSAWLRNGGHADLLVLWEPIPDGADWLRDLKRNDARERAVRPRPRPGVPRTGTEDDGQLMGFAAPQRLRDDLAAARLAPIGTPTWAVVHADAPPLPVEVAKRFELPTGAPTFEGGVAMEATMFLTPPLERVVGQLGHALRLQAG